MRDALVIAFVCLGAAFSMLAAIGILRMPDVFTRMHASSKAGTLGAVCMFVALAIHFTAISVTTHAILVILFLFLTAPVAAHLLGRAAYFVGTEMWKGAVRDDLRGRYDEETHRLDSDPAHRRTASPQPDLRRSRR